MVLSCLLIVIKTFASKTSFNMNELRVVSPVTVLKLANVFTQNEVERHPIYIAH